MSTIKVMYEEATSYNDSESEWERKQGSKYGGCVYNFLFLLSQL